MTEPRKYGIDVSYYTLLKLIGILCTSLPVIVILGGFIQNGFVIESTLSAYYYTNMRDYFVGLLIGVGLFLITYRGYEKIDAILTDISGICIIGVAIIPAMSDAGGKAVKIGLFQIDAYLSNTIHTLLACICFVCLALMCLFVFTKNGNEVMTKEKIVRNRIYKTCGIIMVLDMVFHELTVIFLSREVLLASRLILITEAILLFAFGIAWLVKGKTIFQDKETQIETKVSRYHA
ncbi:MAG TPA: hypothetical protein VHY08_11430 [Bacillota bacterium]|nr:hypothetical protein [Bacillota bacterium]